MLTPHYIAVDLGATNVRTARCQPDGTFLARHRAPSQPHPAASADEVFIAVCNAIQAVWPANAPIAAIGIGSPGPLDPYQGVIIHAPNIPAWRNFPLRDRLANHFRVPVTLENDANCGALGEWRYGAARGYNHILYLSIGTGIGGGFIMHGQLLRGARGLATELGMLLIDRTRPQLSDGGYLEDLVAGPALLRQARAALAAGQPSLLTTLADSPDQLTGHHLHQAARAADPLALAILTRAGHTLGQALADYLHIFNPDIVVIGGGASALGELLFAPMRAAMQQFTLSPEYWANLPIVPAAHGDDAGLIGALALVADSTTP